MLIALSTNPKDLDAASDLLAWMRELQPDYSKHSLLLIGALTLDESSIIELANQARTCGFKQVVSIRAKDEPVPSWPVAANHMFKLAADYAKDVARCPFLWIEPDSIPIRQGWVDDIEVEYFASRKAFMGTIYDNPWKHMNGVAIYPEHVRRFNPLIFNAEFSNLPFDTVRPDLTLSNAHITRLIVRSLANPAADRSQQAHHFASVEDLAIIPHDCALFHGCKDGSLIARLRDRKTGVPTMPEAPIKNRHRQNIIASVRRHISMLLGSKTDVFVHAGNIGDVIYSLPAIKALGGGHLVISPEQRKTAVCSVPISQSQFEAFKPLLEVQPYLKSVTYSPKYPEKPVRDLNEFRNYWVNHLVKTEEGLDTLCKAHFYALGILDKFRDSETWLTVKDPIYTGKIVVARSPRYNSPTFPWKRIVDALHEDTLFVGLKSEHEKFEKDFGKTISFWKVKDLLEMARLVAGAKCFVGNQSSPLSIAIGLGQAVFVEECERSPDCRFNRPNYTGHLKDGIEEVVEYLKLFKA